MLYAAMTFWLLTIVLCAWGVHRLWSGMAQPRVINTILLPGTLVAQLGHVLGLLVTGATVTDTTLYKDDESGEPGTTQDAKPRIPIVGPVAIGLLPLLACAIAIFFAARHLGQTVLDGIAQRPLAAALPTTLAGVWQLVRDEVTLVETLVDATIAAFPGRWPLWLFVYLMICLTVRMAPFPGNLRGSLGAIVLVGVLAAVIGTVSETLPQHIEGSWLVLSLTVATLLFLLLLSAVVRGSVGLVRLLIHNS